jgi:Dolichyl-phosphate-mannose-protein mannosyltransferase
MLKGNILIRSQILLLLAVLALAVFLRTPLINSPSIGYHNMKENEYISMAKNMRRSGDLMNRDVYFYNAFTDKKDFSLYPQIPFVAYQTLLGYKLSINSLWFTRLLNIIWMIFSIVIIFFIARNFTQRFCYSFAAAMLLAIMPLGVYFSRNLQPESGAFMFMLLGYFFCMKFMQGFKDKYLWLFSLSFTITAAYKLPFLIGYAPLLIVFPYRQYSKSTRTSVTLRQLVVFILPILSLLSYWFAANQLHFPSCSGRLNLLSAFTFSYWQKNASIIWHYAVAENYTFIYFLLFLTGLVALWFNFKKDNTVFARHLRAWSLVVLPYFMVFSDYINQHNYYQMPFLAFVCLVIVYCLREVSLYISQFLQTKYRTRVFGFLLVLSLILSFDSVGAAINNSFNTMFPGGDVIGRKIKEITKPDERIFIKTHSQGYAACVYSERKCGWVSSLKEFKETEDKFNIRYVVVAPFAFMGQMNSDIRSYIDKNYHYKMVGFLKKREVFFPEVMVLEKGGTLNLKRFIDEHKDETTIGSVYHTTNAVIPFYVMQEK